MKTLLLVRHAKSSWDDGGISDIDRPLKKSGVKNAIIVAEKLKTKKLAPDLIVCSPAVRAVSTALIFARAFNYPMQRVVLNEIVYDFSKDALLPLVRNTDDKYDTLMLVGHDPALTYLINDLTSSALEKIPTSSVAAIRFGVKHWNKIALNKGRLLFLESPVKKAKAKKL